MTVDKIGCGASTVPTTADTTFVEEARLYERQPPTIDVEAERLGELQTQI